MFFARICFSLVVLLASLQAARGGFYSDVVLSDGPIAYYRLNEAAGTDAIDSTGNSPSGSYMNGQAVNQAGPQGPAFPGFEGTNTAVQFDGVDDFTVFNSVPFTGTSYTLEVWFNRSVAENLYIMARGEAAGSQFDSVFIYQAIGGTIAAYNGDVVGLGGFTRPELNEWHHVVYTREGTTFRKYLDGAQQGTNVGYADTVGSDALVLGQRPDGFGKFVGLMDEFAVYDHVLTGPQINAHYNAAFRTGLYSIHNGDFEKQDLSLPNFNQNGIGDGAFSNFVLKGWSLDTGSGGNLNPTDVHVNGTSGDVSPIPGGNGNQVAYIFSPDGRISTFSQTLPDVIQPGTFTFTLAVGARNDVLSGGYALELAVDGTVLASLTDQIDLDAASKGFLTDQSVSFVFDENSPYLGELLTLQFRNTSLTVSGQNHGTLFDNARLTFIPVPEPGAMLLLISGAGLLVGRGRGRRR